MGIPIYISAEYLKCMTKCNVESMLCGNEAVFEFSLGKPHFR